MAEYWFLTTVEQGEVVCVTKDHPYGVEHKPSSMVSNDAIAIGSIVDSHRIVDSRRIVDSHKDAGKLLIRARDHLEVYASFHKHKDALLPIPQEKAHMYWSKGWGTFRPNSTNPGSR